MNSEFADDDNQEPGNRGRIFACSMSLHDREKGVAGSESVNRPLIRTVYVVTLLLSEHSVRQGAVIIWRVGFLRFLH